MNYRGKLVADEHLDGRCYQFITVAGDGTAMVWDTRFERILADELRHVQRPKAHHGRGGGNGELAGEVGHPPWAPVYTMQIKRLEGAGDLSPCKVALCTVPRGGGGSLSNASSSSANGSEDPRMHFYATSEEGDIVFFGTRPKTSSGGGPAAPSAGAGEEDEEGAPAESGAQLTQWSAVDGSRPSAALEQSPFFPDLYMSVHDWRFNVWRSGRNQPVFSSPVSKVAYTCGKWSPTRPGVIILGCANGWLQCWDLSDSSFAPSMQLKATHVRTTTIGFPRTSASAGGNASNAAGASAVALASAQLLALGDDVGTLHVYEVPRSISRPVVNEKIIMANFIERECRRQDAPINIASSSAAGGGHDGSSSPRGGAAAGTSAKGDDSGESTLFKTSTEASSDRDNTTLELSAEEQKAEDDFYKLELQFIQELGLEEGELPSFAKNLLSRGADTADDKKGKR